MWVRPAPAPPWRSIEPRTLRDARLREGIWAPVRQRRGDTRQRHHPVRTPRRSYPGGLYIDVYSVNALAREVGQRGVTLSDPIRKIDGIREFEIRDCNGYGLRFGQHDW